MELRYAQRVIPFHTLPRFMARPMILVTVACWGCGLLATTARADEGANVRIATFEQDASSRYFAASIQPEADDALIKAVSQADADVVVVIDTSASQVGEFRRDSIKALRGVVSKLRENDRVRIFAADVRPTDLSESFIQVKELGQSVKKLRRRLPLGNTNMMEVIDTVRAELVSRPQNHTRSIVYIGDGTSIETVGNQQGFEALIDALRADRISVHSIAIGPTTNVELMGILANQTGGVFGLVSSHQDNAASSIGAQTGQSAIQSPIWLRTATLLPGMNTVQQNRLPPLRMDRDAILLGTFTAETLGDGKLTFQGETSTSAIRITTDAELETSHPDFSFLVGLVNKANDNDGLYLASAGSALLRETARVMVTRSEELVKAAELALSQGNKRGAKAVAEMALDADPSNPAAKRIEKAAGNRLVFQNDLDAIFGGDDTSEDAADDLFGTDEPPETDSIAPLDTVPIQPRAEPEVAPIPSAPLLNRTFDNPVIDEPIIEQPGGLLDKVREELRVEEGRLRAEVRATLRAAQRKLRQDPTGVAGSLKSMLANVEAAPGIDPELRNELESQLRSAIQSASRRENEYSESLRTLESVRSGQDTLTQLLQGTFRREATLKTLSQQMNALIDEGRYQEADADVAVPFTEIAGNTLTRDSTAGQQFGYTPLALQTYVRDRRYTRLRQRNFVDVFSNVLKAHIPFVDEPPVQFPDADVWRRMSLRRLERYGAIELVGGSGREKQIEAALGDETSLQFNDVPLQSAVQQISEQHGIPIVIDGPALEDIGIDSEVEVSLELSNITLRSFLRLLLRQHELTYVIKDEVMKITTQDAAAADPVRKIYPVGDLVVPIIQLSAGGGGGGGGGGRGGGGGGMGGGGGGGMGGGGMGGGGGGGMFAVPDEVTLTHKSASSTSAEPSTVEPEENTPKPAAKTKPTLSEEELVKRGAILLKPQPNESNEEAWDQYYSKIKIGNAQDLTALDQRIRSTVRLWSVRAQKSQQSGDTKEAVAHFVQARDAIAAAIRAGHVQTWMYQAYAISLKATGAPKQEVERALLSAVDFAEIPEEILHVAARLEDIGSHQAALRLCRDVARMEPFRREPYVLGLRLAKASDDLDGLKWACEGILSQAWPASFSSVLEEARLLSKSIHAELIEQGKTEEARAFSETLKRAASHDVVVRVSWTGDADIDLSVEEPAGTICSHISLSSAGGGTLLADANPGSAEDEEGTISETYLCPQGFSGQYRLLVRRVWGNVSTGRVTVEILTDTGRPSQRVIRQQVPLTEKDALIVFEVKDGKRKEEIGEAQLANLQNVQRQMREQVLAQFGGGGNDAQILQDLYRDTQQLLGGSRARSRGGPGIDPRFRRRGAVGFRPEITTLPEGASLLTLAIISADRRYVRVSPAPFFSQIGDVTTFNFVTGDEGGGGGGAAAGIGGGGGGIGN